MFQVSLPNDSLHPFHRVHLSLLGGEKIEGTNTQPKKLVTKPGSPGTDEHGNRADGLVVGGTRPKLPLIVKDARRPFAHPHYWAPFILIGNWK
jgi:CHAT domain-containing protein